MRRTSLPVPRRGRPPKFGRPGQAVTLTLPEDVIARLRRVDPDLSRAIVRLAAANGRALVPHEAVELVQHGRNAVIVLRPSRALSALPGVDLVPLPDGRTLVSLDITTGIAEFELAMQDLIAAGHLDPEDRAVLEGLGRLLQAARRSRQVSLHERNIIVLQARRRSPRAGGGRRPHAGGVKK
jgi:hypothetical protein